MLTAIMNQFICLIIHLKSEYTFNIKIISFESMSHIFWIYVMFEIPPIHHMNIATKIGTVFVD